MEDDPLFNKYDLYRVIENQKAAARKAAKELTQNSFESATIDELVERLCQKFELVVPTLMKSGIAVSKREVDIEYGRHRGYGWIDDAPSKVRGTAVDVKIPFEGDKDFFEIQPSTYTNRPRGRVRDGKLTFSIKGQVLETENVRKQIDESISSIEQHLSWLRDGLNGFDETLEREIRAALEQRKQKLDSDDKMLSDLGYRIEG